jgi:hypothetical protein
MEQTRVLFLPADSPYTEHQGDFCHRTVRKREHQGGGYYGADTGAISAS